MRDMRQGVRRRSRSATGSRSLLIAAATLCTVALGGCGTADVAAQRASGAPTKTAATPSPAQQAAAATLADLLVTYARGSPCADVLVETPIDRVPSACAAVWAPLHVDFVPGQNLLPRAPHFPQLTAGAHVTPDEAVRYAAGLWRTEAFHGFALGARQLGLADALGQDHLFLRVGADEQAVLKGDTVTTPLCHFFPTAMRVVELALDFTTYEKRTGRTLGVLARFVGPCYATATDAHGTSRELFNFTGTRDAVFVGDVHSGDPLGPLLWVTGVAGCDMPEARKTCAD